MRTPTLATGAPRRQLHGSPRRSSTAPPGHPHLPLWQARILDLQRSAGNAAVSGLVQRASPPGSGRGLLRRGASGPPVQGLQQSLNTAGAAAPALAADGSFGAATDAAVRRYQRALGLGSDGVVGPRTWQRLDAGATISDGGGAPAGGSTAQVAAVGQRLGQIKVLLDAAAPQAERLATKAAAPAASRAPLERAAPASAHDLWDDAAGALGQAASQVVETVSGAASSVGRAVEAGAEWVGDKASQVVNTVGGAAGAVGGWLGKKASQAIDAAGGVVASAGQAVGGAASWVTETAGEVVTGLQSAATAVADTLGSLGAAATTAFGEEWGRLKDIAAGLAAGLGLDTILGWLEGVYADLKKKIGGGDEAEGEGADIHGTLPGVHLGGLGTACDSTDGVVTSEAVSKQGPVAFGAKDYGLNSPVFDISGSYTIYRGRDGVRIDAKVKMDNTWNVQSGGSTSIKGADDPAVTPAKWDVIANDLDPARGEGYPGSPPRTKYWVEAFTIDHEKFHEKENLDFTAKESASPDVKAMVDRRFIEVSDWWRFQRWLGMDPGEEESVKKHMNGFLDDIGKHMATTMEKTTVGYQAECRAYRAGRPAYEKLVSDIRARGRANGWPTNA